MIYDDDSQHLQPSSPPSTSAGTNPPPASCRCPLRPATTATCSPQRRLVTAQETNP